MIGRGNEQGIEREQTDNIVKPVDLSKIKNRKEEDYILRIKLDRKSSQMYRNIRNLAKKDSLKGNE